MGKTVSVRFYVKLVPIDLIVADDAVILMLREFLKLGESLVRLTRRLRQNLNLLIREKKASRRDENADKERLPAVSRHEPDRVSLRPCHLDHPFLEIQKPDVEDLLDESDRMGSAPLYHHYIRRVSLVIGFVEAVVGLIRIDADHHQSSGSLLGSGSSAGAASAAGASGLLASSGFWPITRSS
jgi:hypothetical protein